MKFKILREKYNILKKTNIINKDPLINIASKSLLELPTPQSISFLWNIGFLLGITLTSQVVSGILLSINYVASTEIAFDSIIHIIRDTRWGWIIRYAHINGASVFFLLIYTHIARGVYFNSPIKLQIVWISGVIILLISIIAAFMGYVLPWGQISYWGATVITRMLSSVPYIGGELIIWLWGDFSVSQPTLNRIFSLHFIVPLVVLGLVLAHLIFLHQKGSSNPSRTNSNLDKIKFFPIFLVKDITPIIIIIIILRTLISIRPEALGDPENFNNARITTTPTHIKPEWYFLFAYRILRSVPSKLGGVVAMGASILILIVLAIKKNLAPKKFNPPKKIIFWLWVRIFILLTWAGGKPVNEVSRLIAQNLTLLYFSIRVAL